jgi:hypothetical protein
MLHKTQALRALQQGCSRLSLPSSTAAALLQFLSAKRTHDQFVPETDRQLHMSPGATLDKLWHYTAQHNRYSCAEIVVACMFGGHKHGLGGFVTGLTTAMLNVWLNMEQQPSVFALLTCFHARVS